MSTEQTAPGHLLAGRYRLTELIGAGGMGRVWRGTDELLDRPVAVKELTIPPHLPDTEVEVLRTRMLREARSAARLGHPSIITVFDVVDSDERPWIVMELVRGRSLGTVIKEDGVLDPGRAAAIGVQTATALSIAHDRGIVHRDIKPGNVLIAPGDRAVLTDFGIARLEGTSGLTRTGLLVGSPGYLSPEQAQGGPATPASDIWSLGVTLYQAVEGRVPFAREAAVGTLTAIVTEEVPPPQNAGVLAPVLTALLDKDPERRPDIAGVHRMLAEAAEKAKKKGRKAQAAAPAASAATTPASPPPYLPPGAGDGPSTGGDGRGRRLLLLGSAAAVVAAAAVGLAFWLGNGGLDGADPASQTPPQAAATPSEDASDGGSDGDAEPSSSPSPSDSPSPGTEMATYEDETGFSVDLPEGWELRERQGTSVFFDIPGGGYLQIDQTDDPGDDAKADWEQQEGAISGNFSGYEKQSIEVLEEPFVDRYVSAADWEFTFDGRHAVNRAFHTEEKGYALFLVSPPETWEENRELLDPITASFEPAA
ncbi:serine/threonine-protein kinase [Nocardiopsis suaedae]|uniref:non-specific serine/threonine protein kinase n=1 Tax=Nocardiopsis suaedae TaxID=3018444 RepID=A0ABT4TFM0_9ACTN|nr:serine/threonine-protein kinase [Nocardiopsis suaedae]MDA2803492.1 serine/threonine-protein kinase [Nocardiopsis suaedae]